MLLTLSIHISIKLMAENALEKLLNSDKTD